MNNQKKHISRVITHIYLLLFCLLLLQHPYAQTNDEIAGLRISGNERTKTSYIKHFIDLKPGQTFDSANFRNDQRNLRALPGIMQVTGSTHSTDSGVIVEYQIEERYTLFPVGDFGITEDHFWVGGGAMESNLAGRGIYLYGYYQYSTLHTVHSIFRNPYLRGSKWGYEFQLRHLPRREENEDGMAVNNLLFDISMATRYEIALENVLLTGIAWRKQEMQPTDNNENLPRMLRESIVWLTNWETGHLNYFDFYLGGWNNRIHAEQAVPYLGDDPITWVLYDEFRFYRRLGRRGNFAARTLVGISNEDETLFSPFIADSYYNFRGIGYLARRGNRTGMLNLEYRQTLWENEWGGIQLLLFSDSGFVGDNDDALKEPVWHAFAGPGTRFIYKKAYNAVLSIDYGVNLGNLSKGGWVLGWGQYF